MKVNWKQRLEQEATSIQNIAVDTVFTWGSAGTIAYRTKTGFVIIGDGDHVTSDVATFTNYRELDAELVIHN